MANIELINLSKKFENIEVFSSLDLTINDREFVNRFTDFVIKKICRKDEDKWM